MKTSGTQAVIQVTDVRAAVEEMRGRGVEFEEYDTPETRTKGGIARSVGLPGGEAGGILAAEGVTDKEESWRTWGMRGGGTGA